MEPEQTPFDTAASVITVDGAVDVEGGSIALTAATSLTTNSAITSNGGTIALTANAGNVTVASSIDGEADDASVTITATGCKF